MSYRPPDATNRHFLHRSLFWQDAQTGRMVMSRGGDDDPLSGERAALDLLIAEMLEQAPDRVVRAIEEVVKQLYNEGRYSPWEIEEAAMQLCRELGIPRTMN